MVNKAINQYELQKLSIADLMALIEYARGISDRYKRQDTLKENDKDQVSIWEPFWLACEDEIRRRIDRIYLLDDKAETQYGHIVTRI